MRGQPSPTVLLYATATRVMFSKTGDGRRRATGVRVKSDIHGDMRIRLRRRGEVVVCAGAIGTPKLLMLSGIGPTRVLERAGVDVEIDLPVGRNLVDREARCDSGTPGLRPPPGAERRRPLGRLL